MSGYSFQIRFFAGKDNNTPADALSCCFEPEPGDDGSILFHEECWKDVASVGSVSGMHVSWRLYLHGITLLLAIQKTFELV
jgi:hypothetical protein